MKRRLLALILCLTAICSLVACSPASTDNSGPGDTSSPIDSKAPGDPITVAMSDVSSLDPMKNWQIPAYYFYWTIYERLIRLNQETGEYEPELATDWVVAEDGMSITFHLRQGVKWHDGSDFTSKDVKWTIERGIENGTGNYPGVDYVETPDDYTVVVHMQAPESVFMDKQWTGDCCVMPYGCDDSIAQHPIGTGPYKLKEWLSGDHITIERNEDYWGEPAQCSSITFKIIPEDAAKLIALQSGDVDLSPLQSTDVKHVEADENLLLQGVTSIRVDSLGFNCKSEYFDDVRVRQAVAYAINRQAIVDGVLEGYGAVMNTPVAMGKPDYYDGMDAYEYNPEKAKELLAAAGYEDGFDCELCIRENPLVAQLIQADLAAVGINAKLTQMESAAFLEYVGEGKGDIFLVYRSGGPADIYVSWFDSTGVGAVGNLFQYSNATMDELYEQSHLTVDTDARYDVYKEIQELTMEELPLLPLYAATVFVGQNKNVQGFTPDPEGCHDFRTVTWGNG